MPDVVDAAVDVAAPVGKPWFVYLVRAANGSLYCGISDNPQRRFAAHQRGKGASYFNSSPAVALVYMEAWPSKGEALRHERLIKKLRKSAKEALVASNGAEVPRLNNNLGTDVSAIRI
ncbi:GIY-YIG nuclease family protein [Pseudomonas cichorii]|uniref:GIY-YIG nuclease family protein n=1 Tax=Pseudomonas cichorii TaxID=36746 RepID=UPI001C88FBE0|nr:GIY-YIG nuclease family protein [Pseudomonas cichorii]MBX8497141.1 GIY-YIG nuclease family protein [Pseudomonas cichorii]MBX8575125.1 GIY-YIG nuclease family protein [Pseudomonas cichorii]